MTPIANQFLGKQRFANPCLPCEKDRFGITLVIVGTDEYFLTMFDSASLTYLTVSTKEFLSFQTEVLFNSLSSMLYEKIGEYVVRFNAGNDGRGYRLGLELGLSSN